MASFFSSFNSPLPDGPLVQDTIRNALCRPPTYLRDILWVYDDDLVDHRVRKHRGALLQGRVGDGRSNNIGHCGVRYHIADQARPDARDFRVHPDDDRAGRNGEGGRDDHRETTRVIVGPTSDAGADSSRFE